MPEGDTLVWTAARLNAVLTDAPVVKTDFRTPKLATLDLAGRRSIGVVSYGKHLLHRFDGDLTIHSHLKMEGRWRAFTAPPSAPAHQRKQAWTRVREAERSHTTRALIYTDEALAIGSKLGLLEVLPTSQEHTVVGYLGPDILGADWDERGRALALTNLRSQQDRPLGEALLDQTNVAGFGTFWISEVTYMHRVLPWTPVGDIASETLERIVDDSRPAMQFSAERGIQTSTGHTQTGHTKRAHARSGLPCLRCNDTMRVAMTGPKGRERTLFYCPTCQGGYAPTDDRRPQRPLVEQAHRRPERY